jgi:hypothetical protein
VPNFVAVVSQTTMNVPQYGNWHQRTTNATRSRKYYCIRYPLTSVLPVLGSRLSVQLHVHDILYDVQRMTYDHVTCFIRYCSSSMTYIKRTGEGRTRY